MARNPCPASVKNAGGYLVHLAEYLESASPMIDEAMRRVEATEADMIPLGARKMEYAEAKMLLREAQAAIYKVRLAHNCLRQGLVRHDVDEPSNADIVSVRAGLKGGSTISPMGGGGGGR